MSARAGQSMPKPRREQTAEPDGSTLAQAFTELTWHLESTRQCSPEDDDGGEDTK